jgi:hypothetical protein
LAFGFNLNSFAFAFNVDFFGAAAVPEEATEAEEEERDSVGDKTAWPGIVDTDEGNWAPKVNCGVTKEGAISGPEADGGSDESDDPLSCLTGAPRPVGRGSDEGEGAETAGVNGEARLDFVSWAASGRAPPSLTNSPDTLFTAIGRSTS